MNRMSPPSPNKTTNECKNERCLRLEMLLKGSEVRNSILKEENKKLTEKVKRMEEKVKNADRVTRELTELKAGVRKLYDVAKSVLGTMTGDEVADDGSYYKVVNARQIDKLCEDLQDKFVEWQGSHQLLHDKLEETLNMTEEFTEDLSNKSNDLGGQDLAEELGPGSFAIATSSSGSHYSRLDHVCSKMGSVTTEKLASKVRPEVGLSEAMETAQGHEGTEIVNNGRGTVTGNSRPTKVTIPQDHGYASSSRTVSNSTDGGPQVTGRHLFCKCGRNYRCWPTFVNHLKTMGKSNKFECGPCHRIFKMTGLLKVHLKNKHGHTFM